MVKCFTILFKFSNILSKKSKSAEAHCTEKTENAGSVELVLN